MTEKKWYIQTKKADFYGLAKEFGISPITVRCMVNRGENNAHKIDEYINGIPMNLSDPFLMKDMKKAVDIILESRDSVIGIASDYDCDGIFSGWMLKTGLEYLGYTTFLYTPDRVSEGYGLNKRIVEDAINDGCDVLMTCDNGIASIAEVDYAKDKGLKVIVTDHHEVQETLPKADAIIDPKQTDCKYPFKGLCGAGVVHRFFDALFSETKDYELVASDSLRDKCVADESDSFVPSGENQYGNNVKNDNPFDDKLGLLSYAAIATVADVMELKGENRIIVKYGLDALSGTENKGLGALLKELDLWEKKISAFNIGFMIGPVFNAAGRIDDVKRSFELLESSDCEQAVERAHHLKSINEDRKRITLDATKEALERIENEKLFEDDIILIVLPDCHESIVGIVAGRIKETYNHPVICFSKVEEGLIKGSGRSIGAYDMFSELMKCKDLMIKFGGHKMAAGMTLKEENFDELRRRLNDNSSLVSEDFIERVDIDIALPFRCISKELIRELEIMEPFGVGNTKPVFAGKNFNIVSARMVGKEKNILSMRIRDAEGIVMDGVCFENAEILESRILSKWGSDELDKVYSGMPNKTCVSFLFYPTINEYNGNEKLQVVIKDFYIDFSSQYCGCE